MKWNDTKLAALNALSQVSIEDMREIHYYAACSKVRSHATQYLLGNVDLEETILKSVVVLETTVCRDDEAPDYGFVYKKVSVLAADGEYYEVTCQLDCVL